jgi:hypothetical protein
MRRKLEAVAMSVGGVALYALSVGGALFWVSRFWLTH